jgi:hypothetical protein
MRTAPPVSVRCAGGPAWRALQVLLPALAAAAAAVWGLAMSELSLWPAVVPTLAAAAWGWRAGRQPAALLEWNGQEWSVEREPAAVEVMLDLGVWQLLRWRPVAGGRPRWLAVTAREAGPAVHGLRAALYAPQAAVR